MSYSFWCSGCKKDHAGECPPQKGALIEGATTQGWWYPSPGTKWVGEDQWDGKAWEPRQQPVVYTVLSIEGDQVRIKGSYDNDPHSNGFTMEVSNWSDNGRRCDPLPGATQTHRMRFVPAP